LPNGEAMGFEFKLLHLDGSCSARRSTLQTPHGTVQLPAFMPVGTQGTVKGISVEMLKATDSQMILGNTYHLALRPGAEIIAELGGLHQFTGWDRSILTDSGGFQVFSLADSVKVDERSAKFRSHIDGSLIELSPEKCVEIQELLGSDIAMVLDHVVALPNKLSVIRDACERSVRWAERSKAAASRADQAQFAIVQGGLDADLRVWCAERLVAQDFPGYAVGGLSVGETPEEMYQILDITCPALPVNRPRYLMGVGRPVDILEAIRRGVDLFDCVMPTRNGRNGLAFSDEGPIRLRNLQHKQDPRPLDPNCPCPACGHSRAYLRHLFMAKEMLGPILLSAHNLTYYHRMVAEARDAIEEDRFEDFYDGKIRGWQNAGSE
jgi:queuine tRNA-ribosyltransferase